MEEILKQILSELNSLKEGQTKIEQGQEQLVQGQKQLEQGQKRLEQGQKRLEQGQEDIRSELRYIWDDIKKIDARLTKQEEETNFLKRMK